MHQAGVKVLHKTATARHALKSQEAGVDLVEVGAWVMFAKVCSLVKLPVVASGASGTGRQLAAALAMGACGITMATRFLATVEAPIHSKVKEHMAKPEVDERNTTVVMGSLSNATRVFKNDVTLKMKSIENEAKDGINFSQLRPYAEGKRTQAMWRETGDWNDSMWSCGQSVGLINDVPTCQELIDRIVKEAKEQLVNAAKYVKPISKL